jgi:hypothetical protein
LLDFFALYVMALRLRLAVLGSRAVDWRRSGTVRSRGIRSRCGHIRSRGRCVCWSRGVSWSRCVCGSGCGVVRSDLSFVFDVGDVAVLGVGAIGHDLSQKKFEYSFTMI